MMQKTIHYILNKNGNPIKELNLQKWARWYETSSRQIARDTIGGISISTVFLGMSHGLDNSNRPLLFETMIFGMTEGEYQERYATKAEALEGHDRAVAYVKKAKEDATA